MEKAVEKRILDMTDLWTSLVKNLEGKLDAKELKTWFAPTRQISLEERAGLSAALTVSVPSRVFADWIEARHSGLLSTEANAAGFPGLSIRFESESPESPAKESPPVLQPAQPRLVLNPRYTFDTFVVGSSNQFAHAAARAVAETPSRSYNPLFLYGGVGLGKTHLMHAIAHEILHRSPGMHVFYLSAERFLNELINALRFEKMHEFKRRYRELDVLLMDDVQFIAGKDSTQEEFFHTFNALHDAQKQIVVTSDALPKEIPTLEERLRSRFEWGLIADIQPPDLETKVAILQKKAEQEKVTLPTDVALYVASNIRSNVRELEGALIRLVAHSSLIGAEITLPYAQQVLKNFIDSQARKVTIESIQKMVAEQFGLRLVEIKAKNNSRAIVYPRQVAMYLAKHMTEASLPEIGRQFGGKHHTTVLHSVEKIEELRKTDKDLNRLINKLTEQLGG